MIPSTMTGDPTQIRQDVEKLRAAGREDLIQQYFALQHLNPAEYQDVIHPASGGATQWLQGVAGRGVVTGAENLVRMLPNIVGAATGLVGSKAGLSPQEIASLQGMTVGKFGAGPSTLADRMRLPQPQTAPQRIAERAVEGATGAGPFAALGAPIAALSAGALAGAAGQGAAEMGVGPGGQVVASLLAGSLPALATAGANAIRTAVAGSAAERAAARDAHTLLNAAAGGEVATLGQVAKGGMARTVQGGMRNIPGASQKLEAAFQEQSQKIGNRASDIAERISSRGTPEIAGRAVQRGIEEGFVPRFRTQAQQLYQQAYRFVPEEAPVFPQQTKALFEAQNMAQTAGKVFEGLDNPWLAKWSNNLATALEQNPKGIPFGVLKDFRSQLGDMLSGADLVEGLSLRDVKRLYGAVSSDMEGAIAQYGGAKGTQAWNRASTYWKAGTARLENVLQPLVDQRVPERAFNALLAGTRDGATVLRSTMRSLSDPERRLVAATVLKNLGKAAPGSQDATGQVFSSERFLSRWAAFSPEARSALFESIDPQVTHDLNQLSKAMELIRASSKVMVNPSGTAQNTMFSAVLRGLARGVGAGIVGGTVGGVKGAVIGASTGLPEVAGVTAANMLTERVLTNPRMIRWLTKTTQLPFGSLAAQLPLLAKEAQRWPADDRALANETVQTLGSINWPHLLTAEALADAARVRSSTTPPAPGGTPPGAPAALGQLLSPAP